MNGPRRLRLPVSSIQDIIAARAEARTLAAALGFTIQESVLIATAVSELGRHVIMHAGRGELTLETVSAPPYGLRLIASYAGAPPSPQDAEDLAAGRFPDMPAYDALRAVARALDSCTVTVAKDGRATVRAEKRLARGQT